MSEHKQCAAEVWDNFTYRQCSRRGRYLEDGKWFCKQHLPSEVARRNEERTKKWDLEWAADEAKRAASAARNEVTEVAIKLSRQEATYDELMEAVYRWEALKIDADKKRAAANDA